MKPTNLTWVYLLILIVASSRLVPHPENVTAIGALGLFAGAYLPSKFAWSLPLGALIIGDALLGFYSLTVLPFVYLGFAASASLGRLLLFERRGIGRLGCSVLASATVFFLLSNFGMWLAAYPLSIEGILRCYYNAIPYFGRSLFGDALYASLLFGSYEILQSYTAMRYVNTSKP